MPARRPWPVHLRPRQPLLVRARLERATPRERRGGAAEVHEPGPRLCGTRQARRGQAIVPGAVRVLEGRRPGPATPGAGPRGIQQARVVEGCVGLVKHTSPNSLRGLLSLRDQRHVLLPSHGLLEVFARLLKKADSGTPTPPLQRSTGRPGRSLSAQPRT